MGELWPVQGGWGGAEPEELTSWLSVSKTREPYGPSRDHGDAGPWVVPAQVYGAEPLWGQVVSDLGQWEAGDVGVRKV